MAVSFRLGYDYARLLVVHSFLGLLDADDTQSVVDGVVASHLGGVQEVRDLIVAMDACGITGFFEGVACDEKEVLDGSDEQELFVHIVIG
jgi:hypothetical protein